MGREGLYFSGDLLDDLLRVCECNSESKRMGNIWKIPMDREKGRRTRLSKRIAGPL